jgi:hypothetical protein
MRCPRESLHALSLRSLVNKVIEVRIPSKFLSLRNKEVQRTQLWGTDVYTDDSDAVASESAGFSAFASLCV